MQYPVIGRIKARDVDSSRSLPGSFSKSSRMQMYSSGRPSEAFSSRKQHPESPLLSSSARSSASLLQSFPHNNHNVLLPSSSSSTRPLQIIEPPTISSSLSYHWPPSSSSSLSSSSPLSTPSLQRRRRRLFAPRSLSLSPHSYESFDIDSSDKPIVDLVLSSGFLAFAHHSGFLQAVEEAGLQVAGIMGTSAGALTGSLYAAGYTPSQVAHELSKDAPCKMLRLADSLFLNGGWKGGLVALDGVIERLRSLLPPTFEDLDKEFAVGVVDANGRHQVISSGPLPEAVAASAAIPVVFENVHVPGSHGHANPFMDGGVVDRVGLKAWRQRRREQARQQQQGRGGGGRGSRENGVEGEGEECWLPPCLVHVIERSSTFSGDDDVEASGETRIQVVRSPKSGVSLLSLGDFDGALNAARERARPVAMQLKATAMAQSSQE